MKLSGNDDGLNALAALLRRAAPGHDRLPPVEQWNPPDCGPVDIRIDRDGVWSYMGSPIRRDALVRLFSTVLTRGDDGLYRLVTPVEKMTISVEDVPFLAVEMHAGGKGRDQVLTFRTNLGDVVSADRDHPLRFAGDAEHAFVPYVMVRRGLEARLTRALAFDLADLVDNDDEGRDGFWSGGAFFPIDLEQEPM
ncbi:hypothetical protein HDIA_3014 [Hartmannibacter diazotrophicus]|uniref:DUF1285 domain-containing protein n=1 Tax=Hartmannibacter diazotrophicus TaxID=1482074 RepID=A0A2C9DAC8_9HYPH|nr:DUF1285 domain-containing protein [Hartmannibacter diazotrophicus]SON56555.1 hypothetical protein HDIA_3014 [Hartmannibacter diazotrophicus]